MADLHDVADAPTSETRPTFPPGECDHERTRTFCPLQCGNQAGGQLAPRTTNKT